MPGKTLKNAVTESEAEPTTENHKKNNPWMTLQEATWIVAFLRDVTMAHGLNADESHVGISADGEQGLALILDGVERSLNEVLGTATF